MLQWIQSCSLVAFLVMNTVLLTKSFSGTVPPGFAACSILTNGNDSDEKPKCLRCARSGGWVAGRSGTDHDDDKRRRGQPTYASSSIGCVVQDSLHTLRLQTWKYSPASRAFVSCSSGIQTSVTILKRKILPWLHFRRIDFVPSVGFIQNYRFGLQFWRDPVSSSVRVPSTRTQNPLIECTLHGFSTCLRLMRTVPWMSPPSVILAYLFPFCSRQVHSSWETVFLEWCHLSCRYPPCAWFWRCTVGRVCKDIKQV